MLMYIIFTRFNINLNVFIIFETINNINNFEKIHQSITTFFSS